MLGNLEAALRAHGGKEEALLVATAGGKPPAGRARWTFELWPPEMVRLTSQDMRLSRERLRRRLAENELKPWRRDMWCIPKLGGASVACTRTCDLEAEAPDRKRPVMCFEESPTHLIGDALPDPGGARSAQAL